MDLAKVKNADKLELCRKYYLGKCYRHNYMSCVTQKGSLGSLYENFFESLAHRQNLIANYTGCRPNLAKYQISPMHAFRR